VEGILPDKVHILWNGLFRVLAVRRARTVVRAGGCAWQRVRQPAVPEQAWDVQL